MREVELVALACGLGSFPYIAFPPVVFPDPDFCTGELNLQLDLEPDPEPELPSEAPIAEAEPVVTRREPMLVRMLPPAAPAEVVEAPAPLEPRAACPARLTEVLEILGEPAPEPVTAPFQMLKELHSAIGRASPHPSRREPRGAPKPAAKVALAKAQQN